MKDKKKKEILLLWLIMAKWNINIIKKMILRVQLVLYETYYELTGNFYVTHNITTHLINHKGVYKNKHFQNRSFWDKGEATLLFMKL